MAAEYFLFRCGACGVMQAHLPSGGTLLECCDAQSNATLSVLPVVEYVDGAWRGWLNMTELLGQTLVADVSDVS